MTHDPMHDLARMGISDEVSAAKHNPTDVKSFERFRASLSALYDGTESESSREVARKNLHLWVDKLPRRWKKANLKTIDKDVHISPSLEDLGEMVSRGVSSYWITGSSGAGKTYLAYAIIRRMIGMGRVSPSKVLIMPESDLLRYSRAGFDGQKEIDKILARRYDIILFDDAGTKDTYHDSFDKPVLGAFFGKAYGDSIPIIATSPIPVEEYGIMLDDYICSRLEGIFLDDDNSAVIGIGDSSVKDFSEPSQLEFEQRFGFLNKRE